MTNDQFERIAVFLRSTVGQDLRQMLTERQAALMSSLMTADDHIRMFRAQGQTQAISDLLALFDALIRESERPAQDNRSEI